MDRNQILNELHVLGMTQQTAARLSRIPADRLSRFLGGNSSLRADEAGRLTSVVETCLHLDQRGDERLAYATPTDWSRVAKSPEIEKAVFAAEEPYMTSSLPGMDFGFSGDLDFENPEIPVLTMQLPMRVLKALIAGPSSRFLYIQRHEIVGLLRIIEANPNTSESDLAVVRGLLKKA
jgi:plasmid maintenance system antidote protein VapI